MLTACAHLSIQRFDLPHSYPYTYVHTLGETGRLSSATAEALIAAKVAHDNVRRACALRGNCWNAPVSLWLRAVAARGAA
jgi:hypothetical protein